MNKQIRLFVFYCIFVMALLPAQESPDVTYNELFDRVVMLIATDSCIDAIPLLDQLYDINPNSIDVAYYYECVASFFHKRALYDKALHYYELSQSIRINNLEPNRYYIAQSHDNLGNVYASKGDYDKAISCYEQSLVIKIMTL